MTIKLVTGLPGSGKSTLLVDEACKLREANEGTEAPPRPIYACGIDGLSDDLALPLASPMDWQDLPDGSIVLVDEVWKFWPAKGPAAKEPPEVLMLAEHRHRGFDFIIATQHPSQISVFVRNLCGAHIHLKRKFGTHIVRKVEWGEVVTDLQSEAKWALGVSGPWTFPKDRWKHFKSASLHTVKRTIPKRAYALLGVLVLLPVLGWIGYHRLKALAHPGHYLGQDTAQQGQGGQATLPSGSGAQHAVLTPEQWAEQRTPRVAGVPWSAPMWDGLKPTTTPDLLCAIVEREDGTRDCRCMTEQITPVDVDQMTCYRAATEGVYNPYRAPQGQDRERERRPEARDAQRPATVAGARVSSWPAGVGAQTYTAPGEPGSWNPDAISSHKSR